ncbi:MAG: CoA transferase [Rhodospirillaceae bacterium]|jgi:CoA:oxalate CoA-transferase|nr:CoA transferase [Rhodospirillaceae bacterium]MBT5374574.1 CoA transferase [Rhodospirillaceae bacterium]MBT5658525.1 CoA transferase [Rhodospirillaceae bacterium]MBT5751342.1 CoA transferase [Rhodospirillaceae bacterium]
MDEKGPLDGITVVDLTRILAGPYCTMVLADLGARVIKVEEPVKGDDARHIGPFIKGKSAYFMSLNRDKESIALDLKNTEDKAVFEKLLGRADVLVENFRPSTMEKLGYGWERLHADYPRLIFASASGFGQTGPYKDRAAYDMVVQAMGGIMSLTGHPDTPPTRVGTSVGDITAGLFTTIAINAALFQRHSTGIGAKIDVAMLDCQIAILENAIARHVASGETPQPLGARHPSITPFDAFHAADGYLVIAAGNDRLFEALGLALGRADLVTNDLFTSNDLRTTHAPALKDEIEMTLGEKKVSHWLELFTAKGIPCGPINTINEALADPQIQARNMVVESKDTAAGTVRMAGNPIKIEGMPDPTRRNPAPDLDQDGKKIKNEL